ncbi:hypothetical protein KI387_012206, partial [Taxus chinensis]
VLGIKRLSFGVIESNGEGSPRFRSCGGSPGFYSRGGSAGFQGARVVGRLHVLLMPTLLRRLFIIALHSWGRNRSGIRASSLEMDGLCCAWQKYERGFSCGEGLGAYKCLLFAFLRVSFHAGLDSSCSLL